MQSQHGNVSNLFTDLSNISYDKVNGDVLYKIKGTTDNGLNKIQGANILVQDFTFDNFIRKASIIEDWQYNMLCHISLESLMYKNFNRLNEDFDLVKTYNYNDIIKVKVSGNYDSLGFNLKVVYDGMKLTGNWLFEGDLLHLKNSDNEELLIDDGTYYVSANDLDLYEEEIHAIMNCCIKSCSDFNDKLNNKNKIVI